MSRSRSFIRTVLPLGGPVDFVNYVRVSPRDVPPGGFKWIATGLIIGVIVVLALLAH